MTALQDTNLALRVLPPRGPITDDECGEELIITPRELLKRVSRKKERLAAPLKHQSSVYWFFTLHIKDIDVYTAKYAKELVEQNKTDWGTKLNFLIYDTVQKRVEDFVTAVWDPSIKQLDKVHTSPEMTRLHAFKYDSSKERDYVFRFLGIVDSLERIAKATQMFRQYLEMVEPLTKNDKNLIPILDNEDGLTQLIHHANARCLRMPQLPLTHNQKPITLEDFTKSVLELLPGDAWRHPHILWGRTKKTPPDPIPAKVDRKSFADLLHYLEMQQDIMNPQEPSTQLTQPTTTFDPDVSDLLNIPLVKPAAANSKYVDAKALDNVLEVMMDDVADALSRYEEDDDDSSDEEDEEQKGFREAVLGPNDHKDVFLVTASDISDEDDDAPTPPKFPNEAGFGEPISWAEKVTPKPKQQPPPPPPLKHQDYMYNYSSSESQRGDTIPATPQFDEDNTQVEYESEEQEDEDQEMSPLELAASAHQNE